VLVPDGTTPDAALLAAEAGAVAAHLAPEREFRELFPDCAPGRMPPLGRLVGVDLFVDHDLAAGEEIALPLGGPDNGHLAVRWAHFVRLTNPLIGRFTRHSAKQATGHCESIGPRVMGGCGMPAFIRSCVR